MFSSLLEKVLFGALVVVILIAMGVGLYAEHEHGKLAPMQMKVYDAAVAASQAAADRDAALAAAQKAQQQAAADRDAAAAAAAAYASATAAASSAHAKLAVVASQPDTAKLLDMPVPSQVWQAIYNQPGK